MTGPLPRYRALVESGALDPDPAQEAVAERLQALSDALSASKPSFFSGLFSRKPQTPKGVYLWGGVGRGKSLLMDIFYNNTDGRPKRRVHFHEFMAETHERIALWRATDDAVKRRHKAYNRKSPDDPMPAVAYDIALQAEILCFDEFQVSDIADAMILGRLFEALFARGVVMVTTSNRHPDDLYKDGLNRQLFLPAIEMIKDHLDVVELEAARDYRLQRLTGAPVYYTPLGEDAEIAMDAAWSRMICGAAEREETIQVKGRAISAPRAARGAARFAFNDLCAKPLGASDYLAICRRYGALFIDRIPQMGPEQRNEAKRFVTLVDAIYETRTKLICSAAAPADQLYVAGDGAFEFERTASRLIEMQSTEYLGAERETTIEDESDEAAKEERRAMAALL